jgi:hypothetical protein
MGRPLRPTSADVVSHVLNRANAHRTLFGVKQKGQATFSKAAERTSR